MNTSSDALTFNDLLEEAQALQAEKNEKENLVELGPAPEAARKFQEALQARWDDATPRQRMRLRLNSGDLDYSALPLDAQMWIVKKDRAEMRKEPFRYSELWNYLEFETWAPRDALLILSGIDPSAAIVDWSYENHVGAVIEKPCINRANWFADPSDLYDYPLASDFDESPRQLKREIAEARAEDKKDKAERLERRLSEIQRWANDPTSCFLRDMLKLRSEMLHCISRRWFTADHDPQLKHSPEYFVRWAEKRGFCIEWTTWAREQGLIDFEAPVTEPPFFDADSEDYPELLHIAVRAWDHARTTSSGTPKKRIIQFVTERYPEISEGSREAIALVANWQKTPGRPKSGD